MAKKEEEASKLARTVMLKKPAAKTSGKGGAPPAGWTVKEYERQSGDQKGRMYKVWYDPAGNQYRSIHSMNDAAASR